MLTYITLNNTTYTVSTLQRLGGGGEGEVFRIDDRWAVKLFIIPDGHVQAKLSACVNYGAYNNVANVAATPSKLLYEAGTLHGYSMQNFSGGYVGTDQLADLTYCLNNKITIRRVAIFFTHLHTVLSHIHTEGFIVGDLRGTNVLFKPTANESTMDIRLLDVDSWGVARSGLVHPCTAIHPQVVHPQIRAALKGDPNAIRNLAPHHDWYAFALLFATSLLKCDPFSRGMHHDYSSDERRDRGISCWSPSVKQTKAERLHNFRFGDRLIKYLSEWLLGQRTQAFAVDEILTFLKELHVCATCPLEVHPSVGKCPRCDGQLVPYRQKQSQALAPRKPQPAASRPPRARPRW